MATPRSACVVGAGIIGASTALHLLEAGVREVTVVDAGQPLGGTTPAGAGFVARFGADSDRRIGVGAIPLEEYGLRFYSRLDDEGGRLELTRNGNIAIATTSAVLDRLETAIVQHPLAEPGTRVLDADGVAERTVGAVDPSAVVGGVFMPEGIQLSTAAALAEVLRRTEERGGTLLWGPEVTGVRVREGRATGVETTEGTVEAEAVVIAAGAWAPALFAGLGRPLPLIPTVATRFVTEPAGLSPEMASIQSLELGLWLREARGAFSWGCAAGYRRLSALSADGPVLDDSGRPFGFGRPRAQVLIDLQRRQQERIARVFPALHGIGTAEIIQGMPVYTADGGLYVGSVPGIDALWAACGDNESGVTHGPGMGRLLAELVAGIEPFASPEPFRLDRIEQGRYPDEDSMVSAMRGDRVAGVI